MRPHLERGLLGRDEGKCARRPIRCWNRAFEGVGVGLTPSGDVEDLGDGVHEVGDLHDLDVSFRLRGGGNRGWHILVDEFFDPLQIRFSSDARLENFPTRAAAVLGETRFSEHVRGVAENVHPHRPDVGVIGRDGFLKHLGPHRHVFGPVPVMRPVVWDASEGGVIVNEVWRVLQGESRGAEVPEGVAEVADAMVGGDELGRGCAVRHYGLPPGGPVDRAPVEVDPDASAQPARRVARRETRVGEEREVDTRL